ncbi:MAG: M28 family metallopeptidase [Promethearchaeota archaeon]
MVNFSLDKAKLLHEIIGEVVEKIGPGQPGSKGEKLRGRYFHEKFNELRPDKLDIEPYEFHPNAFLDWIPFSLILLYSSIFINCLRTWIGLNNIGLSWLYLSSILSLVAFIIAFEEFFSYREFIDKFFPKATAENVIATFKPRKERRATLFISGHHDSAREFYLIYKFRNAYVVFILASFLQLFLMTFLAIWNPIWDTLLFFKVIQQSYWPFTVSTVLLYIILPLLPLSLFMFKFTSGNNVPGARDCLAGCVTALGIAQWVSENRPDFIEIKTATLGSEEAGLRGSRRYVAKHLKELSDNTFVLVFDGIGSHDTATIVSGEVTTRTVHDPEWVDFVHDTATTVNIDGLKVEKKNDPFGGGGTDAVSFTRGNIPATTIHMFTPLKEHLTDYHTRRDRLHFVDARAIQDSVEIGIAVIKKLDEKFSRN